MRRMLLAATALCSSLFYLAPAPVAAQDAVHNWAGPYLGMALSGVLTRSHVDISGQSGTFEEHDLPLTYDLSGGGFAPGVTAGYNFQSGNLVFGVEGDASAADAMATTSGQGSGLTSYSVTDKLESLLTLRGRFGVVEGNALLYGTAGIAAGQASFGADIGGSGEFARTATGQGFVAGPVVGAGIEYALTDKLSVKAEGKVYSLASLSGLGDTGKGESLGNSGPPNNFPTLTPTPDPYTATYHPQGAVFTTGLNLHF